MERRQSGESSESGFTLIELLIVIVVLGILAAIVVFSLTGVSGQSKQAACTTDAKSVEVAADAYQAATGALAHHDRRADERDASVPALAAGLGQWLQDHHQQLDGSGCDPRYRVGR